ncbi:uncharacterized protein N7459_001817 [Penicillium hispanicum]|uniref:uncharacterized protein n=1 Tax=Penicillium hispanicum TaxID=1080232 RepID=UPI00253F6E14|nr:uncharacterized protein N7459_001817 [Penicillium hispanicum]KAJ5591448.1 hypothetical protein N7459_001817 [Penicillium hispanicum]
MATPAQSNRPWAPFSDGSLVDQAFNLPEPHKVTLREIKNVLQDTRNFCAWLESVVQILKTQGLDKLIDIRIPRPFTKNPQLEHWLHLSKQIQQWLMKGISGKLRWKVYRQGKRLELADEFIDEAKRVFQSKKAYDQYNRLQGHQINVHPYFALCTLLNQLDAGMDRHVVTSILSEMESKATGGTLWKVFDLVDFQITCASIIAHLEDAKSRGAQDAAPPEPPSQTIPRLEGSSPKQKHMPPPNVTAAAHAKSWRERSPQLNERNQCAYCEGHSHTPAQCWYLNPHLRRVGWKPKKHLWAYKRRETRELNKPQGSRKRKRSASPTGSVVGPRKRTPIKPVNDSKIGALAGRTTRLLPVLCGAFTSSLRFASSQQDWAVCSEFDFHICADRSSLIMYILYGPDEAPLEWISPEGKPQKAVAKGKAVIRLAFDTGVVKEIAIDCVYQPDCRFSLFSAKQAEREARIVYNKANKCLDDRWCGNKKIFGHVFEENGFPFLRTTKSQGSAGRHFSD